MAEQELETQVSPASEPEQTETETAIEEVKPPVERTFTQHEVDKIVQRRVAKAHKRIGALEERVQMFAQQQPKAEPAGAPKREDFQDYESYIEARATYVAAEAVERRLGDQEAVRVSENVRSQQEKLLSDFEKRKAEGRAKYEDFEEVTEAPDVMLTPAMVQAILESESGHEIAYHLGKNPDEAERISSLSPTAAIREMGKLEAKLASAQPAPKTSSAPAPITPVTGREPGTKWDSDKSSFAQFRKGLNKELYGR